MEPLPPALRRELRARAHHLDPVVLIGHNGLTPAVLHEIDVALTAHELIKVRVASEDREARNALSVRICDALGCGPVQQIGRLLVLWRPAPDDADRKAAASPPASGDRRAEPRTRRARAPSGVPRAAAPRRRRGF